MFHEILSGYRVLDLTQNVAGPFCTQVLGDFGAEVIKIERPGSGDDTRAWSPEIGGVSSTFLAFNRNKKSLCIDLDKPEGQDVLRRLAASVDVVIHSMKPGSAEARRFGYEDLRSIKPDLIYCAISAFGSNGPLREMPGYDPLMQAFSGVMSVTGNTGDQPVRVGVSLIDMGTGLWAALGIVAGALQRMRTGKGLEVKASLLDTGLSWMTVFIASYLATGNLPQKMGSAMATTAPYELFGSADGDVFIAAGNDRLFVKVCSALGCPELSKDERFLTNPSRVRNRKVLHDLLEQRTRTMTTADAVVALRKVGAPCSELNDLSQVVSHAQVAASEMLTAVPIRNAPEHRAVASPLRLDGRRSDATKAPPLLGEDTDRLLADSGYSASDIADLRQAGAIA